MIVPGIYRKMFMIRSLKHALRYFNKEKSIYHKIHSLLRSEHLNVASWSASYRF